MYRLFYYIKLYIIYILRLLDGYSLNHFTKYLNWSRKVLLAM